MNKLDKPEKILSTALKLFVAYGFHGTPTSKIASEAGVSNGTLFHYFKTKDELVVASSTGGRTAYDNAGHTLRQGAELALESDLTHQLTAKASFTFLRAVYDQSFVNSGNTIPDGNHIPGIPEYSAYGELAWHPIKGLTLAAEKQ